MSAQTRYRSVDIDGHSIFYRDAGPRNAPPLLLLHGLPSSSRMFEPLLRRLSDRYRLIAPDYPAAQVHILDAGHFALDTAADEIAARVSEFLSSHPEHHHVEAADPPVRALP